jgi:Arc/MetJ-type ribon-helix-helix transcriptional regulator
VVQSVGVATTSFRLTPEDEAILDAAAERFGSRAGAIRAALRLLEVDQQRREARRELLAEWEAEQGPVSDEEIAALRQHFGHR